MLLAIDIGNTNIVVGLFDDEKLIKLNRFVTKTDASPDYFFKKLSQFKKSKINAVIVASVVQLLNKNIRIAIVKLFNLEPLFVNADSFKGLLDIKVKNKNEVGTDRLANAYAAKKLYATPVIIIDFGTATTVCAVDKKGRYLGGAIAPGIAISRDALFEKTAKLPLVDLKFPKKVIGDNTVLAMQSGILFGYLGLIEGLVKRFKKELGYDVKVIATGGLAKIICSKTDIIDKIDMELTLKGLMLQHKNQRGNNGRK